MSRRTHQRAAALGVAIVSVFTVGVANAAWTASDEAKVKVKKAHMGISVNGGSDTMTFVARGDGVPGTPGSTTYPLLPGEYAAYEFDVKNTGNVSQRYVARATSSSPCFITKVTNRNGYEYDFNNGYGDGVDEGGDPDRDWDAWDQIREEDRNNLGYARGFVYVTMSDSPDCATVADDGEITLNVTASLSPSPRD